jgi:hypothetical protein
VKIFLDARRLVGKTRGIGFFLQSILKELSKIDGQNEYILLVRKKINLDKLGLGSNFSSYISCFPFGIADFLSIPYIINKKIKPDLVWFPANNCAPFINKKIKVISTIHDILYFQLKYKFLTKQWFGAKYRRVFSRIAIHRANLIHTITKHNIDIISDFFKISKEKFFYTYHGINISQGFDNNIFKKLKLNSHDYFYTISGSSPNKNLPNTIMAFQKFIDKYNQNLSLVITGVNNPHGFIKRNNLNMEGLIFTGYITNEEKNSLIKGCGLFLFLSKAEGFGMPPAEAIYNDCNILLSDIPVLKEIYNGYANFTSIKNNEEISKSISLCIQKPSKYNKYNLLKKLDWNSAAKTIYNKILFLD